MERMRDLSYSMSILYFIILVVYILLIVKHIYNVSEILYLQSKRFAGSIL